MRHTLLYPLLVLIVFVPSSFQIPCSVAPTKGCLSCTKWLDVSVGQLFCKVRVSKEGTGQRSVKCSRVRRKNRICLREKKGWQQCTNQKAVDGSSAREIQHKFDLNRRQLKELNKGLNVDTNVKRGVSICVAGNYPETCEEMYIPDGDESCSVVAEKFEITTEEFETINPGVSCTTLLRKVPVCVEDSLCSYRHVLREQDTCSKLRRAFKLDVDTLELLNPTLQCEKLVPGTSVCVLRNTNRPLPDMTCDGLYEVKPSDTCFTITQSNMVPIDELLFLNPDLECSNLTSFRRPICVRGKSSPFELVTMLRFHGMPLNCARIMNVKPNSTCESLFVTAAGSSHEIFYKNNPLVQCDKISETQQVCGGTGFFEPSKCGGYLMMYPEQTNMSHIIESPPFDGNEELFFELNEGLKEIVPLPEYLFRGTVLCTKKKEIDTTRILRLLASALTSRSALMSKSLYHFETNPSYKTESDMQETFTKELKTEYVYSLLKHLQATNETVRKALHVDDEAQKRSGTCKFLENSTVSDEVKDCFCISSELFVYCNALLADEYLPFRGRPPVSPDESEIKRRMKRFTCSMDIFGLEVKGTKKEFGNKNNKKDPKNSGSASISESDTQSSMSDSDTQSSIGSPSDPNDMSKLNGMQKSAKAKQILDASIGGEVCIGGTCSLKVSAGGCFTPIDIGETACRFIAEPNEPGYNDEVKAAALVTATLTETNLYVKIQLCILGSEFLEQTGFPACFVTIKITVYPFIAVTKVSVTLTVLVISVTYTATFKTGWVLPYWEPPQPEEEDKSLCILDEFRCRDFCIWRYNGAGSVAYHGHVGILVDLYLFSFNLLDIGHSFPKIKGCNPGDRPYIEIINNRKCDSFIFVQCTNLPLEVRNRFPKIRSKNTADYDNELHEFFNGKGYKGSFKEKPLRLRAGRMYSFTVPNVDAIYTCVFRPPDRKTIATLDVYRGHGPRTRTPHFFRLDDDGIFYSKTKMYEGGKNVGHLAHTYCRDTPLGDPENSEPKNESVLICAECGRRQVLYSLKQEGNFTPDEVNMRTHIISRDILLDWDEQNRSIVYDDERATAFRKDVRYNAAGTFLLFSVRADQEIFSNRTLYKSQGMEYVEQLTQKLIPKLKIDGVDVYCGENTPQTCDDEVLRTIEHFLLLVQKRLETTQSTEGRNKSYITSFTDNTYPHNDTMLDLWRMTSHVKFITISHFSHKWKKNFTVANLAQEEDSYHTIVALRDYISKVEEQVCRIGATVINMDFIPSIYYFFASCLENTIDEKKLALSFKRCAVKYHLYHHILAIPGPRYSYYWNGYQRQREQWRRYDCRLQNKLAAKYVKCLEKEMADIEKFVATKKFVAYEGNCNVTEVDKLSGSEVEWVNGRHYDWFPWTIFVYEEVKVAREDIPYLHEDNLITKHGIGGMVYQYSYGKKDLEYNDFFYFAETWDPCNTPFENRTEQICADRMKPETPAPNLEPLLWRETHKHGLWSDTDNWFTWYGELRIYKLTGEELWTSLEQQMEKRKKNKARKLKTTVCVTHGEEFVPDEEEDTTTEGSPLGPD